MDAELQQFISYIRPVNADVGSVCQQKLEALGADPALTAMAWRLAAVYGTTKPKVAKKAVVLFAGDHAIDGGENVTKGKNSKADALEIATGRGIVNKVAHEVNAGVLLLDMGLEEDIPESEGVQNLKVMHGSHYVGIASAMTEDEMLDALFSGIQIGQQLADEGYTALAMGNVGERALLTAFILTVAFYQERLAALDGSLQERNQMKRLSALLRTHNLHSQDPMDLLQRVGSPDIAGMVGFALSCAQRQIPLVFDNAVTGAAVLLARTLNARVMGYCFPSAVYAEPVHQMQLSYLHRKPCLSGAIKEDQGVGAVLGLSVVDAAIELLNQHM